jgi:hypothetical protein
MKFDIHGFFTMFLVDMKKDEQTPETKPAGSGRPPRPPRGWPLEPTLAVMIQANGQRKRPSGSICRPCHRAAGYSQQGAHNQALLLDLARFSTINLDLGRFTAIWQGW